MRIGLLTLNSLISNPEANAKRILAAYREACQAGADLVVTSELALCGYFPEDRLLESGYRDRVFRQNQEMIGQIGEVPLLLGTISQAPSGKLFNEMWFCQGGTVLQKVQKSLFGTELFDEARYFEAGESSDAIEFKGERLAVLLGERAFEEAGAVTDASLVLCVTASAGHLGSWIPEGKAVPWAVPSSFEKRQSALTVLSKTSGAPVVFVNRVGAEGGLVFDGGSCLVQPTGGFQGLARFKEGPCVVDTSVQASSWPQALSEGEWLRQALGMALRDNLAKQGLEGIIIGLSGGIDSAVLAALAAENLDPGRILGVALPTRFTSRESIDLAKEQAERLGIHFREVNTDLGYAAQAQALAQVFPGRIFNLTDENLQSRTRGALLMALSSEPSVHALLGTSRLAVLNTGNKSEAATGYFTLYGDGIGAFGLLADCLKQRVFALARALGDAVPKGVVERKPTAELAPNQFDESSLLPYAVLDAMLGAYMEAGRDEGTLRADLQSLLEGERLDIAQANIERVMGLIRRSEFKRRQLPFGVKVSPRGFVWGRRMPLTGMRTTS